jgi:hypothetical protein
MSQLNVNIIKNRVGNNGPTISGNTSISGILTAISYYGDGSNLTGIAITGGDNIFDNILVTGISTFQGDANFDGNVTIGGTLTYQDVTNVDAVGMITARKGINVLADGIQVNAGIVTSASGFDGSLTGNVIGDLTGNVTGNVTGNLIGGTIVGTSASVSGMTTVGNLDGVIYSGVSTTSINKDVINREFCEVVAAATSITLPASPTVGNEVYVAVGNFTDTMVIRNSEKIMSLAEDIILDVAYKNVRFVYVDSNVGWRIN